jgi:Uma2 family endonuclease
VVEVQSKNDTTSGVRAKRKEYFDAGVRLGWVLDPDDRTVTAHQSGQPAQAFQATDTLATALLPGFAVPAAKLLAGA